jgi:hypothetical protein
MEPNDIDNALHEIESMIEFAIRAGESLNGVGDNKMFQMPAADANLLDFAILNVQARIRTLRASIIHD